MVIKKGLVSIVIVNWNGKHFLEKCFSSLYVQKYRNFEVIFVDNASRDGSVEWVKKKYPKTKIAVNDKNLGFAEANNIGYGVSKGEYVLFLNNDTEVTTQFLVELINVLESDLRIAGAQSRILLMDDPKRLDSVGAFLTSSGFLYHYGIAKPDSLQYRKQINLYSAKGACMMFKREVLEKVKVDGEIFDNRYFAYFEETDLCHRVWLAGYKIVFAPKSVIYHKMGGTSTRMDNVFIQYHSFKNRINSYLKNLGPSEFLKIMPTHLFLCEMFAVYALIRFKLRLFLVIQKAILWNVKEISITLSKRRYIQNKIRKLRDNKLFPEIVRKVRLNYFIYLLSGLKKYED